MQESKKRGLVQIDPRKSMQSELQNWLAQQICTAASVVSIAGTVVFPLKKPEIRTGEQL
jgi:hypothetical protein